MEGLVPTLGQGTRLPHELAERDPSLWGPDRRRCGLGFV